MKILYISNYYTMSNSSAAIRNNALVRGLVELGHDVDVYTVRYPEKATSKDLIYGNRYFTDLFNWDFRASMNSKAKENVLLTIAHSIYMKIIRVIQFPDRYYKWPKLINVKDVASYDLMITSSDGKISHFVGNRIRKNNHNIKWIEIWGDPWFDDINSTLFDKIRINHFEKKLISLADKVVYVSKPTAESMRLRFPMYSSKIHFVPRSYFNKYNYQVKNSSVLHIVYTGAIRKIYGRNLDDIVSALNNYNSANQKQIVLDIYGEVDIEIRKRTESNYVCFHNSVGVKELGKIYEGANALLYISNKENSTQIPGKLYDYLGTSSLVLCLVNNTEDGISIFLNSLAPKCVQVINDEKSIIKAMPLLVEMMSNTYPPEESFSPKSIAESIMKLI